MTTKHQFKERTPPKGFPRVMLISVHTRSERDLAEGVRSVSSGYNSKADFLCVCVFSLEDFSFSSLYLMFDMYNQSNYFTIFPQ